MYIDHYKQLGKQQVVTRLSRWYKLKYSRQMLTAVEGNMDMRIVFKENDEHGALVTERGGCVSDHPLRLGGDFIELSDDDKISIASDDIGDEETTERRGDEGTKGRGCDEGNNESDSIWPRSENPEKNMDKHKQNTLKWTNGVGDKIEQNLSNTYKKIGYIATA
ncbi:LOW QUALITY PROTEIN: hypothetical protein Cgig2_000770 [Carnegiea gigantea]|uniref:Uncharacterized protein n=1 Tax=Carnegiea gigantea TaxID=171969 RepID=A0A9Q1QM16_9CARY|nr:LOW QUALITY PROTEIN: hypothetical protein Cgig2_000770 [Carnegiea gigantea]